MVLTLYACPLKAAVWGSAVLRKRNFQVIKALNSPSSEQEPAFDGAHLSRRILNNAALLTLIPATFGGFPLPASAVPATAFTAGTASGGLANFLPPLPPQPVSLPRRNLGPAFAVLLLRSGYEVADSLDFIAMQEFQRSFWLLRQSEWEPLTIQYSPITIKQGELSDPNYFDFIAAMQFTTITTSMKNGIQTFREYCGEECPEGLEGEYKLVTRDPELQDNMLLPVKFETELGNMIYNGLREGFQGVVFNPPAPLDPRCSTEELISGVRALLKVFKDQGFCINADVLDVKPGVGPYSISFRVSLTGPANLWALQSINSKRGNIFPVYDAFATAAFLRASERSATCSFSWTDTTITEQWNIRTL
ncbi:hypothetical protein Ndes2526B_g05412 [Nannochloris sp. 'desiccata']|nr:hypothetical protein KSW81_007295 [Chlorella desiccata (nom. nud.)]KAH7618514.1 hypothetical protein NADE_005364 [Chlorella desiccata (nom. nud.)]